MVRGVGGFECVSSGYNGVRDTIGNNGGNNSGIRILPINDDIRERYDDWRGEGGFAYGLIGKAFIF